MIRRMFGMVRGVIVFGVAVYVLFFVQLGERTAFQHLMRIADTDEARELRQEAATASKKIGGKIKEQVANELPERFPTPLGNASKLDAEGVAENDTADADSPEPSKARRP